MTAVLRPELADEVAASGPFDATACLNCGVCTAVCPLGLDVLPRALFHYVVLGLQEKVTEQSEAIYSCLLCRMCEVSCPAGVRITDNVRTLRHFVNHRMLGI